MTVPARGLLAPGASMLAPGANDVSARPCYAWYKRMGRFWVEGMLQNCTRFSDNAFSSFICMILNYPGFRVLPRVHGQGSCIRVLARVLGQGSCIRVLARVLRTRVLSRVHGQESCFRVLVRVLGQGFWLEYKDKGPVSGFWLEY